jgi:spermidine/putrescine transport system substrate-binding protein
MKKSILSVVLVVFMSSVLIGSLQADDKVLRLISWTGYAPPVLIEKFKKETGITVEVTYSNNEEIMSKLRATRGGGFDLAQPSQDRISSVQKQFKIYQPIDFSKIDETQIDPSMLAAVKKNTMVNGASYAVPHVYGTSGLVVNKAKAPNAKDYKDLLDPQYAGRVSYRVRRPILMAMGFSLGYDPFALYQNKPEYKKFLDVMQKELIKGKPVVRNYYENADALIGSMRSGEIWVAMAWEQVSWKLHEENPDIDYVAPTSGAMAWVDTFAIPAKADNVEGAYKWINFSLKPENAAVFTNNEKYGTASLGATKFMKPNIRDNFTRSFPAAVMAKMNWYPTVPPGLETMEAKVLEKIKIAK